MSEGIKLPVASATQEGTMTTGTQTLAGSKSFTGPFTMGATGSSSSSLKHLAYVPNAASFSFDSSGTSAYVQIGSLASAGVPTILGNQNGATPSTGLALFSGTKDTNTDSDMRFDCRQNTNTGFSTTTSKAFQWSVNGTDIGNSLRNGSWTLGPSSFAAATTSISKHTVNGRLTADNLFQVSAWTSTGTNTGTILLPNVTFDTIAKSYHCVMAYTTTSISGTTSFMITSTAGSNPTVTKITDSATITIAPSSGTGSKILLTFTGITGNPIGSTLSLTVIGMTNY